MTNPEVISLIIRLVIGSFAAFFAILLWSKTRDSAWLLVIIGCIIEYTGILFKTMQKFGFISESLFSLGGYELGTIILDNLPVIFISIGLIIMVVRMRMK